MKLSHIKVHLLVQSSITSYRFVHTCGAPENLCSTIRYENRLSESVMSESELE